MSSHAVQIVSIGSEEEDFSFNLDEDALNSIISKCPPKMKVATISCVGAFRTGKSAFLSWTLRFLRETSISSSSSVRSSNNGDGEWWERGGKLSEGEKFDWRGGSERHTQGIWMWSEHFIRRGANGEKVCVILVDTQGLFDNETTMSLTASIFGLSTLLSSVSIYNVSKLIGEDSLQHLALFSEFAKAALYSDNSEKQITRPFQRITFLVRDWQNFTIEEPSSDEDFNSMEEEMDDYIKGVIAARDAKDLKDTREQIAACFDKIDAYLLTHPGLAVAKKTFDGDPDKVDSTFFNLLDRFLKRTFNQELEPKRIHNKHLTASELFEYVKAFAEVFSSGGSNFPEATTLLAATSAANNNNAKRISTEKYKGEMDKLAGPSATAYAQPADLEAHHVACEDASLQLFDSMATFGSSTLISSARDEVKGTIRESLQVYKSLNDSRNPLAGFETYVLPVIVAVGSYILRTVVDLSCTSWSQTCKASSDVLGQVTSVILLFLLIVGISKAKLISARVNQFKSALQVMAPPALETKKTS